MWCVNLFNTTEKVFLIEYVVVITNSINRCVSCALVIFPCSRMWVGVSLRDFWTCARYTLCFASHLWLLTIHRFKFDISSVVYLLSQHFSRELHKQNRFQPTKLASIQSVEWTSIRIQRETSANREWECVHAGRIVTPSRTEPCLNVSRKVLNVPILGLDMRVVRW